MQESWLEPVRGEESSHLEDAVVIVALGELRCRGLVENERHIRMELQGRRGDGAGDGAFDGFGDGGGLGRAGGQQKDFARFEDRAVRDVDVALEYVDVAKEVLVHEMVIALGMGSRQAEVFVEVESDDAGEIERTGLMEAHEMPVKAEHGISRGEAESE